ncbi:MAG TPA: hypothetical protein DEF73_03285 [Alistipes sp.]|nr:hypothetical protein [Alistipes sp.]HBW01225.1 hypothetical protein [Alistipes sp.]
MKKRDSIHLLLAAAALLLATTACTKDELADSNRLPEGQYPLEIARITLGVEGGEAQPWGTPQTRVSEIADGTGSEFSAGDLFAVQIDGKDEVGTYTVQDDNTVKAETPLYWSDTGEHTVTAWYPAKSGTIDLGNQSQSLVYLLSGSGTGDYQTPVTLTFTHQLAKVRVTPSDDALGEVTSLQLYTYTQCTYEKGKAGQGSQEGWIEMKKCEYTENGATITCWEANVVPGYTITKLQANGTEERNLSAAITPEAGKFYNITLDKDKGYNLSTDGRTYEVYNADGLLAWNEAARNDLSINCTLTDNIDLTGKEWTPIGDYDNRYTGTFDGGNHTITGLTINQYGSYVGMIDFLDSGGTVQNLTLENVNITGGNIVGSVVGDNHGTVTACTASGNVSGTYSIGGVVGYNNGTVTACYHVSGNVSGTYSIGGVAGENNGTMTACYHASGNVSGTSGIGGVVGTNKSGTLTACYATGNVTGNGSGTIYVGGVTGTNKSGTLTACYHANGTVSGPAGTTGGVVGYNNDTVTACYWSNYAGYGIGNGTGDATKVDGTTVTWQTAVDAMNAALQNAGSEWRYELTGELPTLKK